MKVKINFERDLKQELHFAIKSLGIKISKEKKLSEILLDYLTIHKKFISAKKRTVLINPDFEPKINTHKKRREIELIKEYLIQGANVNKFQSKRLIQTKFHDHLLYAWNIYHLHLSTKKDKKSNFVEQVNELLFVYITDDKAILLDVVRHYKGIFASPKWLEILHDYFPDTIKGYKDSSIKDVYPKVSNTERQIFWDKGYTIGMTKIRDSVYHSPGCGRTTSGHSMIVIKSLNEILRWIHTIQNQFENNIQEIIGAFNLKIEKTKFCLRIGMMTLEIFEINTETVLLEYPSIFQFTSENNN